MTMFRVEGVINTRDVCLGERMRNTVVCIVVDMLVPSTVNIEDVRTALITHQVGSRLHKDISISCLLHHTHTHFLDHLVSVPNFLFDEADQA